MKKISLALCLVLALSLLAGCGGGQYGSNANYIDAIQGARDADQNGVFFIVADADTQASAAEPVELAAEEEAFRRDTVFNDIAGFSEDAMEKYAISLGFSITQAYGVAVILPKEGREQEVIDMVNAYVETQQKAQENYLPDQYEIAMNAVVVTVKTGEVLMVMCQDATQVSDAITQALA